MSLAFQHTDRSIKQASIWDIILAGKREKRENEHESLNYWRMKQIAHSQETVFQGHTKIALPHWSSSFWKLYIST